MLSIFLIIIGHTSYGVTNTLWKNPMNVLGTLPLIIFRSFFSFFIFISSYYLLTYFNVLPTKSFRSIDLLKTFGICAINYFGLFFFLKSLKYTQISNTIGYSKIGLIIGVIIGYFFYHEKISVFKIFACLLILIAIFFIEKTNKSKSEKISKGLYFTFLSRVFWSSAFFFVPFIEKLGVLLFCTILEFTVFILSVIIFLLNPKRINFKKINSNIKVEMIMLVVLGIIGTLSLNYAIINVSIIIFAFMGLIEPVIGLIISRVYHFEKLKVYQIVGVCLAMIGAFLLSLFR